MINSKLTEIASITKSKDLFSFDQKIDFGLYSGLMGIAIFNFEYYRYSKDESFYETAYTQIDYIFNNIDKVHVSTFCSGLAGIGWGLLYLEENNFIEIKEIGFSLVVKYHLVKIVFYVIYVHQLVIMNFL